MPDWATHLLVSVGAGKALRLKNLHLVLLGTLLPDMASVLGTMADLGWMANADVAMAYVLSPMGSPFGVTLLCLAASLWFDRPARAFGLMAIGAALHLAADVLQETHVFMLAYPLSLRLYSWPVYGYGEAGDFWLSGGALAILVALRFRPVRRDIALCWRAGWLSVLPLALLAAVTWATAPRFLEEGVFDLPFLMGEPAEESQEIMLLAGRVVRADPLRVRKFEREIEVVWPEPVPERAIVSVWGRYQGGRLVARTLIRHFIARKVAFSLLGAGLFLLYWFRIPAVDGRRGEGRSRPPPQNGLARGSG